MPLPAPRIILLVALAVDLLRLVLLFFGPSDCLVPWLGIIPSIVLVLGFGSHSPRRQKVPTPHLQRPAP
ncbi:hypothetical protein QJS66_16110 [Kocuria rhizophila]|nr:hypothetical protein QJS66_16110 [Kocuria rhizophila]